VLTHRRNPGPPPVFRTFRMRRSFPFLLAVAALLAVVAPTASAQSLVSTPSPRTLYKSGPSGRFLMDGQWLFKLDNRSSGPQLETGTAGWKPVTVPNAWNAGDNSPESFAGGVGWYRKEFRLPSKAKGITWIVRFESVNYRSKVWLNGKPIGTNRGAYLPFELRLPNSELKRGGTNRLVIRVDSRRRPTDFPPSGLSALGTPTGGWWNYGGLLREVYLRKVNDVDINTVAERPDLPCATCAAKLGYRVTLRNYGGGSRKVSVTAKFGSRTINLGTVGVGKFATVSKTVSVGHPKLWSPSSPNLYDASIFVRSGGRLLQKYTLKTGIRSIKVVDGKLFLNGAPMDFRGVFVHEDSPQYGFAIPNSVRDQELAWVKDLGATVVRSHYPLSPYTQERMDELGIMQWSEIPVYSVKTKYLKQPLVRALAARELESNININGNHPSVIVWSIGNELSARPGPVQGAYIADAVRRAKALDPTRPVGLAVAGYPSVGCQPEYGPLDVVGINDYFGWYPGPGGSIADRSGLSDYLDSVRACYPKKAIVITEFGAEANRDGPVEEKGTYQFQQDFVNYHLGVFATKPWLSGAIYFALQEFRVRPDWDGGNPRPQPPIHQKGLISFDGQKKPAYFDVQRIYRATKQFRSAAP
jgi:hypothetical protein